MSAYLNFFFFFPFFVSVVKSSLNKVCGRSDILCGHMCFVTAYSIVCVSREFST